VKVVERPAAELKPYPGNPRIPGQAVQRVAASIREFGWRQPIVVDEHDEILVGHTRRLAAIELDQEMVPVHVAEGLSEAQKKAYRLADNRLNEYAAWDDELLEHELRELAELGIDMELTGFSVTQLRRYTAADMSEDPVVQDAPPRAQPGELWICGQHRILCGDATREEDVALLLQDDRPVLMVTDPPYGVNYDPTWRADHGLSQEGDQRQMQNDDRVDWREAWALFPGDVAYVWHGALQCCEVAESLRACDFMIRAQIVWAKQKLAISRGHYHWQHETAYIATRHEACWYSVRNGEPSHWTGSRGETTLWEIGGDTFVSEHPTQKPIEAMARPMMNSSEPGDYVYDPFVGSGTSLLAAERTGRRCLALELDPKFADVAIARWEAEAGQEATRHEDGT
jgi:DNA modification methylase